MSRQYEAFCAVDPLFYDSVTSARTADSQFPAARRPVPAGWTREPLDDWLVYAPAELTLPAQGWKIHVSATLDNAERILDRVFEYCVPRGLSFKFIHSRRALLMRNAKYAPRRGSGKFVTIYPLDEAQLEVVCTELGAQLAGEPGPYILSDLRVGAGPLYVRYGAFAERYCIVNGKVTPAIADATGTLVPDPRGPVFAIPDWISLPGFLAPDLAARNATTVAGLPYRIESVIHFSNGGGLYTGVDTRTGQRVVLKEARPYAGLDGNGADAVTRLSREHEVLTRLAGIPQVPRVHERFELGEHQFLAIEYVDARSLNQLRVERYPLISATADEAARRAYADWAVGICHQVEQAIAAINAHGIVYTDLHLLNVLVRPDDRVVLVDYEIATDIGDPTPRGLGDQAFAAPRDRTGYDIDRYALACLRLAMFLPLTAVLRFAPGKARHYADVIAEHFELPPGFLDEAVSVINGSRPAPPRATEIGDWPATRAALAGAILASATPDRSDRLFPGDIEQFAVGGGLNLAYGAAGVLYTLAVTGAGRYPEHEEWFARRAPRPDSGARCGFYDGLHGMAYVLHRLGRAEEARKVLDISLDQKWDRYGLDLFGGLSGIALNLRYFADVTDDPALAEQASRAVDLVAERLGDVTSVPEVSGEEYPYAGLLYGSSGPALLFLHEYARTGDPSRLDLAAVALRQDLRRCVRRDDGQLHVNEGWRTMPYLAKGSVGIGLVLDRYLAHHADEEFADASTAIHRAATAAFYAQSGLSAGRAGIIYYLADRARRHPAARAELAAQIHRLAWHGVPYRGHLAFPGEQLLRLSMDLATGTAGVLLSLGAALHHEPVDLPFLAPVDPADVPDNRGGETNPNETREEVSPDGTAGPASDGAGR